MIDLNREDFFCRYFEKDILFRRNAFALDFSLREVESIIESTSAILPYMKIFKDGPINHLDYCEDVMELGLARRRIKKSKFYNLLRTGATVVLNRIDSKSAMIAEICRSLSRLTHFPTFSNAYFALGGQGTFGRHWDTHDVFIMQLWGQKEWKVFPPTTLLPLGHQHSSSSSDICPDAPVFHEVLSAGDLLYIPRGWWHEALPSQGQTFHIAVGLHPPTVADYLLWIAGNRITQNKEFRETIPSDLPTEEYFGKMAAILGDLIADPSNFSAFKNRLREKERMDSPLNLDLLVKEPADIVTEQSSASINSAYDAPDIPDALSMNGLHHELNPREREILSNLWPKRRDHVSNIIDTIGGKNRSEAIEAVHSLLLKEIIELN